MTIQRALFASLILICSSLLPAAHAHAADLSGTLIVANRPQGAGSISLIDLPSGAEMARLPIGPMIPHEVAVSPDGRYAVAGEYGSGQNPGRRVIVIDIVNARIAGSIDLGPNSRPHSFAFLPDGRRVVATMENFDRIALVDIEKFAIVKTYPTGGRDGHMVRVSADGTRAYVTSRGAEGTLSAIALREDLAPVVIPTGLGAEGLALSSDGTEVWVVNRQAGTISIINTGTLKVSATIPARIGAGRAEFSAAGRVLVPNGAAASAVEKYLTVYDSLTRRLVVERGMSEGPGAGAFSIFVTGEQAFVADRAARSIAIYDLTDLSETFVIATDRPDPDGIAYSPLRLAVMNSN